MQEPKTSLTVAIPTYNRTSVLDVVSAIARQELFTEIELLILDNCSDMSVASLLESAGLEHTKNIRVVRNKANIGGNANIIRCVEEATGEWVALMADDDKPLDNYLESIYKAIKEEDAAIIKLGLSNHPSIDMEIRSIGELVEYLKMGSSSRFGSLVCISNTVLNRNLFIKNLKFAYQYITTCMPHLIPLMVGFETEHSSVRFVADCSVEWVHPDADQSWNLVDGYLGFATLPLAPCGMRLDTALEYAKIIRLPLKTLVLRITGHSRQNGKDSALKTGYYACKLFNYGLIGRFKLPYLFCWLAATYPGFIEFLAHSIYGKKPLVNNYSRT